MKKTILLALFVLMGIGFANAQTRITGTVVSSEDGQPLPFVTVSVKGTTTVASTGTDGTYAINVPGGSATLTFSFMGYQTIEEIVGNRNVVNVAMILEATALEEIVVIGYGSQSTKRVTTAIASVKAEAIQNVPVASVEQALQGKMSGVHIQSTSGRPGSPVMMTIRGRSSISAGNDPLYVIDGVPITSRDDRYYGSGGEGYSPLSGINMDDIESIDVLKDAAAAAIYGSRGSNGVVLITTKKGRLQDHRSINFSSYVGFQSAVKKKDLLNAREYRTMVNESYINAGESPLFTDAEVSNPQYDTDWIDQILASNSIVQNYQVSASGGSNTTSYFASLGYFTQEGLLKKGSFDRYSARLNADHKFSDYVKIGANMSISRTVSDETTYDNSIYSPWPRALVNRPDEPIYNADGSFYNTSYNNPARMFLPEMTNKISKVLTTHYAEIKPIEGLTFRSAFGIDYTMLEQNDFYSSLSFNGSGSNGSADAYVSRRLSWVATQTLQYRNSFFNNNLNLDATAVYEYQETERDYILAEGSNFPSDQTKYISAAATSIGSTSWTGNRLESYLARVNLAWQSKYLLGASIRADGSSKFPKDGRWGYFPSISGGWNIDEEAFMAGIKNVLSTAKIRFSYGRTGNQEGIGDFSYLRAFASAATYPPGYNNQPGFLLSGLGSPNLTWEKTDQIDLGLDIGFLNNRINLQFDIYKKNTKDLLLSKPIPSTTGFSSRTENIGELEGKGIDITVSSVNFNGDFKWNTSLTASFYTNEVTKLYNDQPINGSFVTRHAVGQPLGSFFLVKALGVDPQTGDMIYEDITGEGDISDLDRQFVGDPLPNVQGGLNNSLSWKGFDFQIFLQYAFGHKIYKMFEDGVGGAASLGASAVATNMLRDIYDDRWTTPGQVTSVPRAVTGAQGTWNTRQSTRYLEYGDYIRLKNITLGYTIPASITSKIKIASARVYVSAQNLFTITGYSGYDPEITTELAVGNFGVDQGAIPQMRTIMFGINLNF